MSGVTPGEGAGAGVPAEAYGVALSGLPGMGPIRLRRLLDALPPSAAWAEVVEGRAAWVVELEPERSTTDPAAVARRWSQEARLTDVGSLWAAHVDAGVRIAMRGGAGYPTVLAEDAEGPAVLFSLGDLDRAVELPAVGIIGSRRCTYYGREVARELGRELAAAGVAVVSGLAAGIDGAAHVGALEPEGGAPPVGVVGSGLDVVYPRRHAELWRRVAQRGVLLAEAPLGARPEAWRFPARNRIIATLARVLVVVEAHAQSGSTHTVNAADTRGRTILAVPGPVRSAASAGTNALIAEGAAGLLRDVRDVLAALGLQPAPPKRGSTARPRPSRDERAVLDAVGWQPASIDQVALRLGAPVGPVSLHLESLARDGWLRREGAWWERVP